MRSRLAGAAEREDQSRLHLRLGRRTTDSAGCISRRRVGLRRYLAATAVEVYGPSCEAIRTGDIHALPITYYCMGLE